MIKECAAKKNSDYIYKNIFIIMSGSYLPFSVFAHKRINILINILSTFGDVKSKLSFNSSKGVEHKK